VSAFTKVLAIDPGPVQSAWVVYAHGQPIGSRGIEDNATVLRMVRAHHGTLTHLAVEMVESFGMAVGKEVFETVFWIGRFVEAWLLSADEETVTRIYRKEVKLHLCQSMRAKDPNVRQALLDRLGPAGTKRSPGPTYGVSKDLWSALAVAVTFCDRWKSEAP
jgi:hypothetical protein